MLALLLGFHWDHRTRPVTAHMTLGARQRDVCLTKRHSRWGRCFKASLLKKKKILLYYLFIYFLADPYKILVPQGGIKPVTPIGSVES